MAPAKSASKTRVASLDDLRKTRIKSEVVAPSGLYYDIRPLNLERHALSGGMPAKLRSQAMKGAQGVNELLASDGDERISEEGADVRIYLDLLVAEVIASPSLFVTSDKGDVLRGHIDESGDIKLDLNGPKLVDPEAIDLIPPVDYKWALAIAMGECDEDGEGKRLWGREPLSRWATFREFHSCDADCERCSELLDHVSNS